MSTVEHITTDIVIGDRTVPYLTFRFGFEESIKLGAEVAELLGDTLDLTHGIGSVIAGFGRAILERGDAEFVARILKRTARDGVKLDSMEAVRGAYEGNLGELVQAIAWVVRVNWSDFFAEGVKPLMESEVLTPLLAAMRASESASWMRGTSAGSGGSSSTDSASPTTRSSGGGRTRKSRKR